MKNSKTTGSIAPTGSLTLDALNKMMQEMESLAKKCVAPEIRVAAVVPDGRPLYVMLVKDSLGLYSHVPTRNIAEADIIYMSENDFAQMKKAFPERGENEK